MTFTLLYALYHVLFLDKKTEDRRGKISVFCQEYRINTLLAS